MADEIDQEINAIKTLLEALEPLSARARRSALEYVLRRLEIDLGLPNQGPLPEDRDRPDSAVGDSEQSREGGPVHIKTLKEQKNPRSASEMAALVAYYLSQKATGSDRKDSLATSDIETWFKIADFKLPERPEFTLANAMQAGYLKKVDRGQYALNPVGYNLIVHSLPRDAAARSAARKKSTRRSSKKARKKTVRKKSSKKGTSSKRSR